MGQQACKWRNADAVSAAKFMRVILGPPQVASGDPGGLVAWDRFGDRTLLGGAIVFRRVVVADMSSGYIWLMLPAHLDTAAINRLLAIGDPRINYNAAGGHIITSADTLGMAISLMRAAVYALEGDAVPAGRNETNNVNDATSEYADLVLRWSTSAHKSSIEHYRAYDDGHDSNLPGPLAARDSRDAKFYTGLDRADYPYVANNDRSSVSIPTSRYNMALRPERDSAHRVINGRGALAPLERMTQFDGRVSNDPLAVALTDDYSEQVYAALDAAESGGDAVPRNQRENRRLYEANYAQSGAEVQAQMLNAGYVGPVVSVSGDPSRFTQSAWPGNAVLSESARGTASYTPARIGRDPPVRSTGDAPRRSAGVSRGPVHNVVAGNVIPRNDVEHFASNSVRFQPSSAFIYYNVGSDTMDIDRTYGTVSQDQRFPALEDVMYGYHSLPPLPPNAGAVAVSGNFKPAPATERFASDPFLTSRAATS